MTNYAEEMGPLTPEQHEEMLRHPLHGLTVTDLEEDRSYYNHELSRLSEDDPAFDHFDKRLRATQRYLTLKRRFDIDGVSTIVPLDKVYDDRR